MPSPMRMSRRDFVKLLLLLSVPPSLRKMRLGNGAGAAQERQHPNVLILLFDTLSAPHLSVYGYRRETTPNLARFAESATVYHAHYAAGNFTAPGTASLLTGTYPWSHRAFHHAGIVTPGFAPRHLFRLFRDTHHRLAYPHNLWAHLLLNQFREDVETYVDPAEFSLADFTFYDRFFSADTELHIAVGIGESTGGELSSAIEIITVHLSLIHI